MNTEVQSLPGGRFLDVDGITLHVRIVGNGEDVLLVHGFPDDGNVWRKQVPALVEAGYRVIVPDMRGCGESKAPERTGAYAIEQLVADLTGILDALNVPTVRLVAHDWGAVIGWQFCMRHPERVNRYIALSVGHPNAYALGSLEQKFKGWYILLFQLRGFAEWLLMRRNWAFFRYFARFPDETEQWISNLSRPGRLTAAINYYRANLGLLIKSNWPAVQVPVFGLWSSHDAFLAESQMINTERFVAAGWRYARIDGAGHWLQIEAPARVNELLIDYLK